MKRIVHCAAINVDPDTAARDLDIPHTLMQRFGHADCGVYAEVIAGGEVAVGAGVYGAPELTIPVVAPASVRASLWTCICPT